MILTHKSARQTVPWYYGLVADYPYLRMRRYWIKPFHLIGRWVRSYIFELDATLNRHHDFGERVGMQLVDIIPPPNFTSTQVSLERFIEASQGLADSFRELGDTMVAAFSKRGK